MPDIIINNATILTMDPDRSNNVLRGNIHIKDGVIKSIYDEADKNSPGRQFSDLNPNAQIIDGDHLIVMPGLINTHGHAAMSLLRSYADDLPLMKWLEKKIFPVEARLTADDVYWGTLLSISEMIRGGTTTFTDMYFFMEKVAAATAESGIRAVLSRGMVGADDEHGNRLKEIKSLFENWNGAAEGRITINLGPHAIYTCPPEYLKTVCSMAEKLNTSLQIHVSETRFEVESCMEQYGSSPVEVLNDTGIFNYPVICAHCVHLNDNDISILAEKGAGVAHNPGSNLKLGSGIAPLFKMLQAGINVGLGTDGPSSNNNLDMFEEMRLAALLPKGISEDPTQIPARKALELATSMGAEVLSIPLVGKIKEGYRADIIGITKKSAHLLPSHDIEANLVYSACGADTEMVMVNGKMLMENRVLLTLDEEKIFYESEKCAKRLTGF